MKKVLKLTESNLIKLIKNIIREQSEQEIVISPEEYYVLLKNVYYQANLIPKLRAFRGKKLVIDGSLDFQPFENEIHLTDLGSIKVNGNIDISYTKIKSLDNVEVSGSKRYWSTPYEKVIASRKQKAKFDEQEVRREENEWNLNDTDEVGEKAHAVFEYAVQQGNLDALTDDDKGRVEEIRREITELEEQQSNLDAEEESYDDEWSAIEERLDSLNEEMEEILTDKVDVYDLYPNGWHYDMTPFESLSTGHEYAVGTTDEADNSVEAYYEDMLDRPNDYFSKEYLSNYIDSEKVKEYFEDAVEEWVRDSPDSYGVENQLSDDQEEEIWLLEMEKWVYENEGVRAPISEATKEDGNVFDFEDSEDNRFQYKNNGNNWVLYKDGQVVSPHQIYDDEDTEEQEETREERISDIEYEIEEIKDNPYGDPSDDDIQEAVENYLDDIERDALSFLKEMGYTDFSDFMDLDKLKEDLKNNADYGETLNAYDGQYEEITINGTEYIVMRIN